MWKFLKYGVAANAAIPFKQDPLSAIYGIASGASSLASLLGNSYSNSANQRIADATNATNMAINRMQIKAQKKQWERETSYNSPSQQVMRLRAAGVNPASLVNGGNAQPMQFNSPIPMQAYKRENIVPENVFSRPLEAYTQSQLAREEVTKAKHENYLLGVNAAFAVSREINDLLKQKSEIVANGVKSEHERSMINDINERLSIFKEQEKRQKEIDNQSLSNLKADYDEKVAYTKRQDALAIASKKHWSNEDAISWYNAQTSRQETGIHEKLMVDQLRNSSSARQTANLMRRTIDNEVRKGKIELKYFDKNQRIQQSLSEYTKDIARLSVDEKRAVGELVALHLKHEYQLDNSIIASIIRKSIGVDLSNFFSKTLDFLK